MFGPFSLGDSLRVYRLQGRGVHLDIEQDLMRPRAPLWGAWLALVTQQAMGAPAYVLYDPHDGEAFLQLRYRAHQAAADIACLAPSLAEGRRAARAWSCLLDGACIDVSARGIQRVFASVPESGPELDVFHQTGFALYAGEEIYRLVPRDARNSDPALLPLRPQRLEDWPALQRLCVSVTPQRVRQAEGGISLAAGLGKNHQRYVLPGSNGDEVLAAVTMYVGTLACWVRMLVHPDSRDLIAGLVEWLLAVLSSQPARPVFCSVRKYEGGFRVPLETAGFELYATRALLVKHTAAWVKAPVQELVPALKGRAEPVPPALKINGEPGLQPSGRGLAAKDRP